MDRRKFLVATGSALSATALAGCGLLGSNELPPPRKSDVFVPSELQVSAQAITVSLVDQPEVQSAAETGTNAVGVAAPVGVARAAKGRGAVGRGSRSSYSSAPHRGGWAIWHGEDDDDEWYDEHQDQVEMYEAAVPVVALARVGDPTDDEDNLPGAGPPGNWDARKENVGAGEEVRWERDVREGWYRVGARLEAENADMNMGWSCLDVQVTEDGDEYTTGQEWKVEPRLNVSD